MEQPIQTKPEVAGGVTFELVAVPAGPEPNDERLFVQLELERVDQILRTTKQKGVVSRWLSQADGPSLEQWRHYRHKLNTYLNSIERYERAITEGIVPFRIDVTNTGAVKDYQIDIRVKVLGGQILLARQLPLRPARPEGHQHALEMPTYNVFGGFTRTNIRMGKTTLAAQFSELAAGDDAALVNQTLFLEMTPETRLSYELTSRRGAKQRGFVSL
ncbi:MAG TPA: hypothetical protein VI322_01280 [Candidatus Saccharimonadia bacterium]